MSDEHPFDDFITSQKASFVYNSLLFYHYRVVIQLLVMLIRSCYANLCLNMFNFPPSDDSGGCAVDPNLFFFLFSFFFSPQSRSV